MSSLQLDQGMVYEPPWKNREVLEREIKLLVLRLLLSQDQFTLADIARLKELLEELG